MEESVPKRRYIKFRRWGITHKKTYNKTVVFYIVSYLDVLWKQPKAINSKGMPWFVVFWRVSAA